MTRRNFDETDLREMLEAASALREDVEHGRWVAETGYHGQAWEVVLEPDIRQRIVLVMTAFPVEPLP